MHYTAGFGALVSFGGARMVDGDGVLPAVARMLLDGAGGLFGVYLLVIFALTVAGAILRRRPRSGAGPAAPGRRDDTIVLPSADPLSRETR